MNGVLTEVAICPMTEADLDEVLAIEAASFPHPWSRTHFQDELRSTHAFPFTALDGNGRVIGYICPMLIIDEGHILNVAVHHEFRGCGIGKMLVEKAVALCREGGQNSFHSKSGPRILQLLDFIGIWASL